MFDCFLWHHNKRWVLYLWFSSAQLADSRGKILSLYRQVFSSKFLWIFEHLFDFSARNNFIFLHTPTRFLVKSWCLFSAACTLVGQEQEVQCMNESALLNWLPFVNFSEQIIQAIQRVAQVLEKLHRNVKRMLFFNQRSYTVHINI